METILKAPHINVSVTSKKTTAKTESAFWAKAESLRFGIIPMLLFVLGCMSGIAAAFGAQNDIFKLALVSFPTIATLAFVLAVTPMRLIIWAAGITMAIDIILLFI